MVDLTGRVIARLASGGLLLALCLIAGQPTPLLAQEGEEEGEEAPGTPPWKLIVQDEYFEDSNDNTFHDASAFLSYRQAHIQAWAGEFTDGVEVGGFLRDGRRSAYSGFYRFRDDFDHVVQLDTEQIVDRGFVVFAGLRYIRVIPEQEPDRDLFQPSAGFDKYYGNYHFFSFRAIRDGRDSDRYSFVVSNRFASKDKYLTLGIVPRTDGNTGYFVRGKWAWFRAGFGKFPRFDFADIDRTTVDVGVEFQF